MLIKKEFTLGGFLSFKLTYINIPSIRKTNERLGRIVILVNADFHTGTFFFKWPVGSTLTYFCNQ